MSQAAQAVQPADDARTDVSTLLLRGVESGTAYKASLVEAARAKTIAELEAKLKLYEFQEAARLVTMVRTILEHADGKLEATVVHVKAQMRGFDNYVQLHLHAPGTVMPEQGKLPDNAFTFTVREHNVIALGRGQQNPREDDIKKPAEPPKPSATGLAVRRAYNAVAPSIGLKPVSLEPKPVKVIEEKPKLTTAQQTDQIIMEAGSWCAMRGYLRKANFTQSTP